MTATGGRTPAAARIAAATPQYSSVAANPRQARAGSVASRALSSSRSRRAQPAPTAGNHVASPIPPPSGCSLRRRFQIHPCASLSLHTKGCCECHGQYRSRLGPDSTLATLTTVASVTSSRGDPTRHRQDRPALQPVWRTTAHDVKIDPPRHRWSMGSMSRRDPEGADRNHLQIRLLQTHLGGPDLHRPTSENVPNRL